MGVSPALPITPPWDHMAWRHMAWQQCERRRSNILTEKLKAERFTATGKKKKTLRTGYKQEKKLWKPRMVRRFWAIKSQDQIHQSIIVLAGTRWKEMTPYQIHSARTARWREFFFVHGHCWAEFRSSFSFGELKNKAINISTGALWKSNHNGISRKDYCAKSQN